MTPQKKTNIKFHGKIPWNKGDPRERILIVWGPSYNFYVNEHFAQINILQAIQEKTTFYVNHIKNYGALLPHRK